MSNTLLLCDCLGSQTVNAAALSEATGLACSGCHTSLCTTQIDIATKAIEKGDVVIACLQEAHRFAEVAEELEVDAPYFIDIRDRADYRQGADRGVVSDGSADVQRGYSTDT